MGAGVVLSVFAVLFSWTAATFPGEWQEDHLPEWRFIPALTEWGKPATKKDASGTPRSASFQDWVVNAERLSLHDWLFSENPDPVSRRRFPFSNTLVLSGLNIYEGLGIDDPEKAKWHDFVFRARGRDLRGAIFDFASLPKVDFEGSDLQDASLQSAQLQGATLFYAKLQGARLFVAQLQGASLVLAQLQGAALDTAQLQGAPLGNAQLQGASLTNAQLQGAKLEFARLQGASLERAQLQGASLIGVQLQGADLDDAQLQGASLDNAQLQGASLDNAQLQGASLDNAQLQGASLRGAALQATDLSGAYLWRTRGHSKSMTSVRLPGVDDTWRPVWRDPRGELQRWDDKAYGDLQKSIEALPPGNLRDRALELIRALDCADKTLASCDPNVPPPLEASTWTGALKAASVNDTDYAAALGTALKEIVCSSDDDAIYVMRGDGFRAQLEAASAAASGLIDDLMDKDSKDCPVAAAVTDADRATLLRIKRAIAAAPKPASGPDSP